MIQVICVNHGKKYTFEAVGHASADETEEWREICAAASVLDATAAVLFEKTEELNAKIKRDEEKAAFGIAAVPKFEGAAQFCETILMTILTGYMLLAEKHPESVHVMMDWEDTDEEETGEKEGEDGE